MKTTRRRILHGLFFTVAALGTLAGLFYAVEDWRGARAWAAAERDLQARGEPVDLHALIPPPVPDDQNLAMAPLFTRFFQYQVDPGTGLLTFNRGSEWYKSETYRALYNIPWGSHTNKGGEQMSHKNPLEGSGNWMTGHALNLARVQQFYRQHPEFPHATQPQTPAEDILLALTRYTPLLDELARSAAERPQTRFPVNWTQRPSWGITLPHYNLIQTLTSTLRLRAVAELAAGRPGDARRDVLLMLHLRQTMERDPTLIAGLVDITALGSTMQVIWEGLAARQWSAEDMDAFRDGLRGINVLREFQQGMRCERDFFAVSWPRDMGSASAAREFSRIIFPVTTSTIPAPWSSLKRWLWWGLPYEPSGWIEQNSAFASLQVQEYGIDTVDPANRRLWLDRARVSERTLDNIPVTPYTFIAEVALPVFSTVVKKFAQTTAILDQAMTACALEKYYLDRHAYPAALAELVPAYLDHVPHDVIDGAPMRYRRTVDGRFQLYSIGADGKDDGGIIAWPADRKWRRVTSGPDEPFPSPHFKDQPDWVWQYAPAEPPDPPVNTTRLESLP